MIRYEEEVRSCLSNPAGPRLMARRLRRVDGSCRKLDQVLISFLV